MPTPPPFDLEHYNEIPRVETLILSPDGRRLVAAVGGLSVNGRKFVTALWQLDPAGQLEPRRLTRSAAGESAPAYLPDGSLLFTSARPDPGTEEDPDEDDVPALWRLPSDGGEAYQVAAPPGGVDAVVVARDAGTVVYRAGVFPDATGPEADGARQQARKDAGVNALLFTGYPIRFWDHDLGPREPRLYAAPPPAGAPGLNFMGLHSTDLTPAPGRALDESEFTVSPDGSTLVTTWTEEEGRGFRRSALVAFDTATGDRRTVASDRDHDFGSPSASPDGRYLVAVRTGRGDPTTAPEVTLWLVDLRSGEGRDLTPDLDLWPRTPAWAPDSSAVYFVADEAGRAPVFRVSLGSGEVTRLAREGAFWNLCVAPDGATVYALRSSWSAPPTVVAVDTGSVDGSPRELRTPGVPLELPGSVTEMSTRAEDGVPIHSWLVLPPGAGPDAPAPLVLWVHGGPLMSWNAWTWRWCPHLLAAAGYAVLLPDPALSAGYGRAFVQRGWGEWGGRPYTDVLAAVDAAVARPDIDAERTAAMGGSFGGYLVNWIAGHTDRFRAIVTHASLWALDQFHGTTDAGLWWEREFGDPYADLDRYLRNSPHRHLSEIRTPMLVTHGERDARVPVSEALRLWTDLIRHDVEAQFLFFPDENHWILGPGNAVVWYRTVLAFLDHHVRGEKWQRPELL